MTMFTIVAMSRSNPKDFNSMRYLPQLRSRIRTYLRQQRHSTLLSQEDINQILIPELLRDEIINPIIKDLISQQINELYKTDKHYKFMANHHNELVVKKIKELFNRVINS